MSQEVNQHASLEPSLARRLVRWLPLTILLLAMVGAWLLFQFGGLLSITVWYLAQLVLPTLGFICLLVVIVHAIRNRRFSLPMAATLIFSLIAFVPLLWMLGIWPVAYPASLEGSSPAATVRLPADAPLLVAWGGDSLATNYHAAVPDQRWAYDLVIAPYFAGSERLEDYGCYGAKVVAPATGVIAIAHDGEADQRPGDLQITEQPLGNHVVIELPTGTYLLLAHMKQGSVTVSAGESVTEGQIIGQCGNSGHTSEPHIHIHHQRQSPADYPLNFAEGLPLYFRNHDGQAMPVGGIRVEGDEVIPLGDTVQHQP